MPGVGVPGVNGPGGPVWPGAANDPAQNVSASNALQRATDPWQRSAVGQEGSSQTIQQTSGYGPARGDAAADVQEIEALADAAWGPADATQNGPDWQKQPGAPQGDVQGGWSGDLQAAQYMPPSGYQGSGDTLLPVPQPGGTWSAPIGPIPPGVDPRQHAIFPNTALPPGLPPEYAALCGRGSQIVRIPIRMEPGASPQFSEDDIVLYDGDIVFIESRETEVFYTGGLLGGGQYLLPRDYDVDIVQAISIASNRTGGGNSGAGFGSRIGGVSALNQDISVSASDAVILRPTPEGGQIPIKVDLRKALRDPKYRVRILPGDYIVLQYRPHEAVAAFVERNLLAGGLFSLAAVGGAGR